MTEVLEQARKHFSAKRNLEFVTVKEWGEAKVFYYPEMNMQEQKEILDGQTVLNGLVDPEMFVTALMVRARNEDGTIMFSKASRKDLMLRVDPDVIQNVVASMGGIVDQLSVDAAEKNL